MTHSIVDIHGLAKVLLCSENTVNKTWAQYPHFFIGLGRNARGVRFDINDVLEYLKERDYASARQDAQNMERQSQAKRFSSQRETRVQNKDRGKGLGNRNKKIDAKPRTGISGLLVLPGS